MTKKEAVESFKRVWMPVVRSTYERNKRADYVARSEAWNRFTDSLHKEGRITENQYNTWTHPSICSR